MNYQKKLCNYVSEKYSITTIRSQLQKIILILNKLQLRYELQLHYELQLRYEQQLPYELRKETDLEKTKEKTI